MATTWSTAPALEGEHFEKLVNRLLDPYRRHLSPWERHRRSPFEPRASDRLEWDDKLRKVIRRRVRPVLAQRISGRSDAESAADAGVSSRVLGLYRSQLLEILAKQAFFRLPRHGTGVRLVARSEEDLVSYLAYLEENFRRRVRRGRDVSETARQRRQRVLDVLDAEGDDRTPAAAPHQFTSEQVATLKNLRTFRDRAVDEERKGGANIAAGQDKRGRPEIADGYGISVSAAQRRHHPISPSASMTLRQLAAVSFEKTPELSLEKLLRQAKGVELSDEQIGVALGKSQGAISRFKKAQLPDRANSEMPPVRGQ